MKGLLVNSIDEIIQLYKRDIDVTLLEETLRRTVEERLQALEEFERWPGLKWISFSPAEWLPRRMVPHDPPRTLMWFTDGAHQTWKDW